MFSNIGRIIKGVAMAMTVITLTLFCVCLALIISAGKEGMADYLLWAGAGAAGGIVALLIYGFGQLIENSDTLAGANRHISKEPSNRSDRDTK